jgi:Flavodoxin
MNVPGRRELVRALVVYESMFGNTEAVAQAIAEGIRTRLEVELDEVGHAPARLPQDVGLLVVGGPTHAHGMTKPQSRADAGRRAGDRVISRGIGMREWLSELEPPSRPIPAAVFDTRIKGPSLIWGSAAKAATGLLARSFDLIRGPESFLVDGPTGPVHDRLLPAELDRARAWGAAIAEVVHAAAVRTGR